MKISNEVKYAGVILIVVTSLFAFIVTRTSKHSVAVIPRNGDVYYMGPMVNKSNPNMYGYEDGSRAPTPPGVTTSTSPSKPMGPKRAGD